MIQLFKSNNPSVIFLVALLAVLLRMPYLSHVPAFQIIPSDILGYYLYQFSAAQLLSNPLLYSIVAITLTLLQALWWNNFLNNVRFLPQQNYLPAFVYVIYTAALPDFCFLSQSFFIAFIVIWILQMMVNIYRKEKQSGSIFNVGFAAGLAALISAHALCLIVFAVIALAILRPNTFKEWLNFLVGVFIPFFLLGTWFFYINRWHEFVESIYTNLLLHRNYATAFSTPFWISVGSTLAMIFSSYFILKSRQLSRLVLIRKFFNVLFHLCWITAAAWFLSTDRTLAAFYILAIPVSFYFAYYLCIEKKEWKANVFMGLWIATILFSQYYFKLNLF